ncbi:MAG: hypothetical protein ACT4QF_24740 [Sporichthyaceae bacterium]|jgi:hypothetical protein
MFTPTSRKACLVLAASATLLLPTNAFAADEPVEAGDIAEDSYAVGLGKVGLFDIEFVALKDEGKPAKGTFSGKDALGSTFSGKITCLQFEGDKKAAFVAVADSASSPLFGAAQLVTVFENGPGQTGSFGFASTSASAKECTPGDASMKADNGNVKVVPKNTGAK